MNRYFSKNDPHSFNIDGYEIPQCWWSRAYEYLWAKSQAISGETVIDAGCGFIHPLKYMLAKMQNKVYAVDYEDAVVTLPKTENVEYVCADICNMPFEDNSIDTVYCISVIEHLDKDKSAAALKEFARVLKYGGRVILTVDIKLIKEYIMVWAGNPREIIEIVPPGFGYEEYFIDKPSDLLIDNNGLLASFALTLVKLRPFPINSREWWEQYFKYGWIHGIDGRIQTRYFMRQITENMPFPMYGNVLDWGCAMGQGVDEIKKAFPDSYPLGYDYASSAIKKAKEYFPEYPFIDEIISAEFAGPYDFVVTSNCLEHFLDYIGKLREILPLSKRYVVILVPHDQVPHDGHPVTINENSMPETIEGFKKVFTKVIPTTDAFLSCDQIMFIYERTDV